MSERLQLFSNRYETMSDQQLNAEYKELIDFIPKREHHIPEEFDVRSAVSRLEEEKRRKLTAAKKISLATSPFKKSAREIVYNFQEGERIRNSELQEVILSRLNFLLQKSQITPYYVRDIKSQVCLYIPFATMQIPPNYESLGISLLDFSGGIFDEMSNYHFESNRFREVLTGLTDEESYRFNAPPSITQENILNDAGGDLPLWREGIIRQYDKDPVVI